jgi:thiol:disulfide interchange protein
MYSVLTAKWCVSCEKLKKRLSNRDDIKYLDIDEPNAFNLFCQLRLKHGVKTIPTILKYENETVIVITEEDL